MNAHHHTDTYLALLSHPLAERIEQAARTLNSAMQGANNVNTAVERVIKIVKALKSFSRFNQKAEKIDADLAEGVETVLTIYQAQTKHGVEIVRNYEAIPLLHCLPDELVQVWTNLIHNAMQAMKYQGTLTLGVRTEGQFAVVSVTDTGCGIPDDIRDKIFDAFFTTKPTGEGSGLGLDIVNKIIHKHNGRIELWSEVGVGSTFTVFLPIDARMAVEPSKT
jgi:signal transduction histidine kinase